MTAVISNASPLIGLCKIDLLYVLKELWREVTIPEAVYREVVVDGKGKPGSNVIENACKDWIKVVAVKNRHEVEALQAILYNIGMQWGTTLVTLVEHRADKCRISL